MNLSALPEGCLSHILSLTSPVDVIRSSAVSKQFLSASESDAVWEKFLPSDYHDIKSQSSSTLEFRSKKELFLFLSRSHILVDAGTKSFSLDKWSGKKCYMLGARALAIAWGDTPEYWIWKSMPESRFSEVAELVTVCWLDIKGKIHTKLLTPNTTYGVYFVFKLTTDNNFGFENVPVKVSVTEVDEEGLPSDHNDTVVRSFYLAEAEAEAESESESESEEDEDYGYRREPGDLPVERADGWMEIEIGRYQVGIDGSKERVVLEMTVREVDLLTWKDGLVVHGIELRPLD